MPRFSSHFRSHVSWVCSTWLPMDRHKQGEQASTFAVQTGLCVYDQAPQVPTKKCLHAIYLQIHQNLFDCTRENLPPGEISGNTQVGNSTQVGILTQGGGDSRRIATPSAGLMEKSW